jgi:formate/nitrite transporter
VAGDDGYKQEDELPEAAVAATKAAVSDLDMPEAIAPVKPAPAPPAPTPPPSLIAVPAAGYEGAVAAGVKKAELSIAKCFVLAIASGTHIAFGAFLALTIGGDCPGIAATDPGAKKMIFGAFGLPFGLFMTVITGSELFTGNAALVPLAYLEGKATVPQVVKSLVVSWVGNLVGSLFLVWLVHTGGTLAGGCENTENGHLCTAIKIADAKVYKPFDVVFAKAIMCNWLVCMAVYMASFARDATGKFVAIWLPISAFVALGLEHTVANMFLIPVGMVHGAPDADLFGLLVTNLLPVTFGNIAGALIGVTFPFYVAFGGQPKCLAAKQVPSRKAMV